MKEISKEPGVFFLFFNEDFIFQLSPNIGPEFTNPKMKSHMFYRLDQPGAPSSFLIETFVLKSYLNTSFMNTLPFFKKKLQSNFKNNLIQAFGLLFKNTHSIS